jgi:hypothetical protein
MRKKLGETKNGQNVDRKNKEKIKYATWNIKDKLLGKTARDYR